MDPRACASRDSSSSRCVARSMLAERLEDSASVLAVRDGWAVVGPWVSPERREDEERISARSCFLRAGGIVS